MKKKLKLPNVTLLAATSIDIDQTQLAMRISLQNILFGAAKLLSSSPPKKKYSDIVKALMSVHHTSYNSSMLLNSYDDCFNLIDSYYTQISDNADQEALVIKFEDIISNPEIEIQNILSYCNLPSNEKDIENVAKDIDKSRSYAYRNNPDLLEFENLFSQLIKKMGYSD